MDIRNILCPVDFSDPSRDAMRFASDLCRVYGARLTLLHAYAVPGYVLPEGFVAAGPDVLEEIEARTRTTLKEWLAAAQEAGAQEVELVTAMGNAAPEIVLYAKEHPTDLIVVGTHGRTGIVSFLLGSVADKVVHTAHCPVLIVPARHAK